MHAALFAEFSTFFSQDQSSSSGLRKALVSRNPLNGTVISSGFK
jgi:hypothetical protein